MKLHTSRPERRNLTKIRAGEVLGQAVEPDEPFFDLHRDVPREDLEDWKVSLNKKYNAISPVERIKVFSAAKLVDFSPKDLELFRVCPWLREAWIQYFNNFFKTSDYTSYGTNETIKAYETAVDFMQVFPEARAELLASRDTERDFQLMLHAIPTHTFCISFVPTLLRFWPHRREEILRQADPAPAIEEVRQYPNNRLWMAVSVMLVFPQYSDELKQLMLADSDWEKSLDDARRDMQRRYYNIPRYYKVIQELLLLAAKDAHINEQGKIVIRQSGGMARQPMLPDRPQV